MKRRCAQVVDAELAKMKEAVQRGDVQGLRILMSHATLPVLCQAVDESRNQSLLMLAIQQQQTEAALLLIEKRAPVKWRGREGRTALHDACMTGNMEVASVLLDKGAAVGLEDEDGVTPFRMGCMHGHVGIVELLLKSQHFTPSMWRKHLNLAVLQAMDFDNPLMLQSILRHGPGFLEHQGSFWASISGRMLRIELRATELEGPVGCYRRVRINGLSMIIILRRARR